MKLLNISHFSKGCNVCFKLMHRDLIEKMTIEDKTLEEVIVLITIECLLCVLNLVGNAAVILCYVLSKECRSVVGLLLLHLAICDSFAVLRITQDALDIALDKWYTDEQLHFNRNLLCMITANTVVFSFYGQSYTLCGIAINRYMRVTKTSLYCKYVERNGHIWTLVCVWIITAGLHTGNYLAVGPPLVANATNTFAGLSSDYLACAAATSTATRIITSVAVFCTASVCYGGIFKYFIETHLEVKAASTKDALVPSVWEKSKNMMLHIFTILMW